VDFRKTLSVGNFYIPGWSSLFEPSFINDGTIAIFIAVLLFIVPESNKKEGLLTWDVVPKFLNYFTFWWRVCFSKRVIDSGLSNYVGENSLQLEI
jgi:sodium-dependent dicarboxylate transporter 2/3/5